MKASEFTKEYGVGYSKDVLGTAHNSYNFVEWYPIRPRFYVIAFGCNRAVSLKDLKHLVESYDLVESYGGLDKAKLRCYPTKHLTMESYHTLKQAIIDVESCL